MCIRDSIWTEEIETLAATDGLDISAMWGDDRLTALHRATLAGNMDALGTVRRSFAAARARARVRACCRPSAAGSHR